MTIRVYLVDDHALVRTGMKMILSNETDIEVVGEAESGEDALPDIRRLRPDVVLCDLHLPGVEADAGAGPRYASFTHGRDSIRRFGAATVAALLDEARSVGGA